MHALALFCYNFTGKMEFHRFILITRIVNAGEEVSAPYVEGVDSP